SGIIQALIEDTRFLSDPRIKASTATSSFSMADMVRNRATVYVVIPFGRMKEQKIWLRLVLANAMQTFKQFPLADRPSHRCLFLIDEFAALGRMDDVPR